MLSNIGNIFLPILVQGWQCWPTVPLYWRNITFVGQRKPQTPNVKRLKVFKGPV